MLSEANTRRIWAIFEQRGKPGDQRKMVPEIPTWQLVTVQIQLHTSTDRIRESPPTEVVVQIRPTKRNAMKNENPPNGSWGIVQIPPTKRKAMKNKNPPNGSWGIVQIRPSFPQKVHVAEIAFDCVLDRFVSEAGSEQSTNFPLVGFSRLRSPTL